jgi:hypothetical protein
MKKCIRCGEYLQRDFFSHQSNICFPCKAEKQRKRRDNPEYRDEERLKNYIHQKQKKEKLFEFVNAYKAAKGCCVCGDKDPIVLDFHHLDPSKKKDSIALLINQRKPLETVMKEIEKCVVICSNDHRRLHAGTLSLD